MAHPRLKRILQNLALSALSLLLCVTLLEVILRFNGYGKVEIVVVADARLWLISMRTSGTERSFTWKETQSILTPRATRSLPGGFLKP